MKFKIRCASVIFSHVTSHPKTQWLTTAWFTIFHESVSWLSSSSAGFTWARSHIQLVTQLKIGARMASLPCLVLDAESWLDCLCSWPHGLSPSQKRHWLLTWKFLGRIHEDKGRSCKIFGGLDSEFHTTSLPAKQITRPVQIQGVENTAYPRLLGNQLTNSISINHPLLSSGFSFSLCPFHCDIYNLRIKGRQVLKCENTKKQKGKEAFFFFF